MILSHYFCTETVLGSGCFYAELLCTCFLSLLRTTPLGCASLHGSCRRNSAQPEARSDICVEVLTGEQATQPRTEEPKEGKGTDGRLSGSRLKLQLFFCFFSGRGERLVLEFGAISSHLPHCGRPPGTKAKCCLELIGRSDSSHTAGLPSPLGETRFCT